MPIFIKLLATKIVANNFFGRSNSLDIILKTFGLSSKPFSISLRVNEKKATSAPEINAEHNNSAMSKIIPETNDVLSDMENKIKLAGSGSKVNTFG